jgi:hypothetical protein
LINASYYKEDFSMRPKKVHYMIVLGLGLFLSGVTTAIYSQSRVLPQAIQGKIPQRIQDELREISVPRTAKPISSERSRINPEQAKEIAAKELGDLASQASDVRIEHLMVPGNVPIAPSRPGEDPTDPKPQYGKPRATWVVTFDGVARPAFRPALPPGQKLSPPSQDEQDEKVYLQTVVFVDSDTGEVWQTVGQGKAP